jgi:hypothetical protein
MILQETVNPNFRIRANLEDNDDPLSETNKLLPREVTMNSWKFSLASPQDRCVPVLLCLLCAALSPSIVGRASDATKSRGNLIHKCRVGLERSLVCVVIVTFCLPIISCMGHNCSPGSLDWYTIYVYYTWAGAPRFWGPGAVALPAPLKGRPCIGSTRAKRARVARPDLGPMPHVFVWALVAPSRTSSSHTASHVKILMSEKAWVNLSSGRFLKHQNTQK